MREVIKVVRSRVEEFLVRLCVVSTVTMAVVVMVVAMTVGVGLGSGRSSIAHYCEGFFKDRMRCDVPCWLLSRFTPPL